MTTINSITIVLDTYDKNGGARVISIPVKLDDEMVPAIEKRWQEYADEQMKLAGLSTDIFMG